MSCCNCNQVVLRIIQSSFVGCLVFTHCETADGVCHLISLQLTLFGAVAMFISISFATEISKCEENGIMGSQIMLSIR